MSIDRNLNFINLAPVGLRNPENTQFSWWGSALIESVKNSSTPQARVDDMVTRTMGAFFKLGQEKNYPAINFDYNTQNTFIDGQPLSQHVNIQADHFKLIRMIGAASAVVLKNTNGALPLNAQKIKRTPLIYAFLISLSNRAASGLAILGSDAGPNPDGPNNYQNGNTDHGCSQGTLAMGWGSETAEFPYLIDPLSAIQTFMRTNNPTTPVEGLSDDFNFGVVDLLATQADTCLVFKNTDSGEGYITVDGNSGDRMNIRLWQW
ncbi:glycoside hydrolase family 3 protein [Sphaerobolus stellatus SS14]|uniref:beta-glucosidase n=1 Tax=Sphaerobolus stellatus (strain SS14) TaxID=990650 RepID=A0A0C9VAR5_SPHS4|nr:glycoside hydrolase family 3 protein [Sphaerobolus stellatus SS14]